MKPTSKVIKTFMVNHEYTRSGGEYSSVENTNYLIAHCEDGSIWKTTQDILYVEDGDWKCILEAPKSEALILAGKFRKMDEIVREKTEFSVKEFINE